MPTRLAGQDAPERILWITPPNQPLSIDGRGVWFDAPLRRSRCCADICRWWSARGLAGARARPGPMRDVPPVATVETTAGKAAAVPRVCRQGSSRRISGVASDPLTKLQTLAYHAPPWTVSDGRTRPRIPLGTAAEPNVIGATGPIGYCGPKLAPPPATITVGPAQGAPGWTRH